MTFSGILYICNKHLDDGFSSSIFYPDIWATSVRRRRRRRKTMASTNDKKRAGTVNNPESEYAGETPHVGTEQERQAGQASNTRNEREELQQAAQSFINSLFQTGTELVKIPIKMLPQESRGHFLAAGRELSQGFSKLAGRLADELDKMVKDETVD